MQSKVEITIDTQPKCIYVQLEFVLIIREENSTVILRTDCVCKSLYFYFESVKLNIEKKVRQHLTTPKCLNVIVDISRCRRDPVIYSYCQRRERESLQLVTPRRVYFINIYVEFVFWFRLSPIRSMLNQAKNTNTSHHLHISTYGYHIEMMHLLFTCLLRMCCECATSTY